MLHAHEKMKKYLDNFIFLLTFLKIWLGRLDSNQGWRYQKPLPYRLATPQQAGKMMSSNRRRGLAMRS
jgi:hypothetical protein